MYKILVIHNIFIGDIFYGHIETNFELPFPPYGKLSIRKDQIETHLYLFWEGPIFDIDKNQFEFTGQSKFKTEEEAKEKIDCIIKSENHKFISEKNGIGYRIKRDLLIEKPEGNNK